MKIVIIKKKESVIYNGSIYEYGNELEMDKAIAESLIERGYAKEVAEVEAVIDEETTTAEQGESSESNYDTEDLSEMSYQNLKKLAKEMGLNAAGTKEELIERISACEDTDMEDEAPNTDMPD